MFEFLKRIFSDGWRCARTFSFWKASRRSSLLLKSLKRSKKTAGFFLGCRVSSIVNKTRRRDFIKYLSILKLIFSKLLLEIFFLEAIFFFPLKIAWQFINFSQNTSRLLSRSCYPLDLAILKSILIQMRFYR